MDHMSETAAASGSVRNAENSRLPGVDSDKIYLIDGSAFIHRAFYAQREMTRGDGFPTNSIFIVTRLVLKILRERRPKMMVFVVDGKRKNFRHELYPGYKANRSGTPEQLILQIKPILDIMEALGIKVLVSDDCEADDYLASMVARFSPERPVVLVGADKDLKQCLSERVVLWDPSSKDERMTTLESFIEETGLQPKSWADYQALIGDSSDNIPGLPGVGPKTALSLLKDFPTLEDLRDNLGKLPPKLRLKVEGKIDDAMLYRKLTTLRSDCSPVDNLEDLTLNKPDMDKTVKLMEEYELRSVLRELSSMQRAGFFSDSGGLRAKPLPAPKSKATLNNLQGSLFQKDAEDIAIPDADSGPRAVEQGSLLDFADSAALPGLSYDDLERIGSPGQLPPLKADRDLALIGVENACCIVAQETWEYLYHGPLDALAKHILQFFRGRPAGGNTGKSAADIQDNGQDNGQSSSQDSSQDDGPNIFVDDLKRLYQDSAAFTGLPLNCFFDLGLAAYLINPEERDYSWPQLVRRHSSLAGTDGVAASPGVLALRIGRELKQTLSASKLRPLMRDLEQPLVPVLYRMEKEGLGIEPRAFASFLKEVRDSLLDLSGRIYEQAGGPFNIRSSQQLGDILYSRLALPKAGKTKGGQASTSHDILERLAGKHPIVDLILEYRKLEKLRSTYLEPLPKLADPNLRIHTSFNQKATATGRLSSSEPNLQNIPVRGHLGERMRACFAAGPGNLLVSADYSQIELRVLAHLSQDPTLIETFKNKEDIHTRTASLIFERDKEEITPDERRAAKTINFGLIYGMGPQKLARELRITLNEAKVFIERYFSGLKKLREFYRSIEEEAKNNGFVVTMAGRRRFTPEINSKNSQVYSQARRQAINTRIQGSAADIIKLAMLAADQDPTLQKLGARLILQVHDELILEVPEANARQAGPRLAEIMSSIEPGGESLGVPILVDWGVGKDWSQAH